MERKYGIEPSVAIPTNNLQKEILDRLLENLAFNVGELNTKERLERFEVAVDYEIKKVSSKVSYNYENEIRLFREAVPSDSDEIKDCEVACDELQKNLIRQMGIQIPLAVNFIKSSTNAYKVSLGRDDWKYFFQNTHNGYQVLITADKKKNLAQLTIKNLCLFKTNDKNRSKKYHPIFLFAKMIEEYGVLMTINKKNRRLFWEETIPLSIANRPFDPRELKSFYQLVDPPKSGDEHIIYSSTQIGWVSTTLIFVYNINITKLLKGYRNRILI